VTWAAPAIEAGEDGWENYASTAELAPDTADGVAPGGVSPEAAVAHFYASRMRGDSRWSEVLPPEGEREGVLERKLAKMKDWGYEGLRFLKRKPKSRGRYWVKVGLDIRLGDRLKSITNEVTVQEREGSWVVIRPPT